MADGGQIVSGKFIGGLLYMEGQWLDQLPIMKGYTLEDKALTRIEFWKYLFLKLIVKSFRRLCRGQLNSTNRVLLLKNTLCTLCVRGWGFHAMPFFNCNILQGVSITELFQVYLVESQALGEGALVQMFLFSLVAYEDCLEVCFVGLVVERICVWCLVIVVIFMGFGQAGAKRCGDA